MHYLGLILKLTLLEFQIWARGAGYIVEIHIGVKWTARTPPKRQVEGSNPSEPALYTGSYTL